MSRWCIASISKVFTALAALTLGSDDYAASVNLRFNGTDLIARR